MQAAASVSCFCTQLPTSLLLRTKLSSLHLLITPNNSPASMSSESASLYSTTSTVPASLYSVSSKTLLKSEEAPSPRRSSSSKVSTPARLLSPFHRTPNLIVNASSQSRALFAKIFKSDHSTPARSPKTPEEIFREIMSINAHSGAPQVKVSFPLAPLLLLPNSC